MGPLVGGQSNAIAPTTAPGPIAAASSILTAYQPWVFTGPPYFAYSTARVSRITVTLIWPG